MNRNPHPSRPVRGKPPATREATIAELLRRSKRRAAVPIRRAFVQKLDGPGPDAPRVPGALHKLMRHEDAFELLLLTYAVTVGGDFGVTERAETWARATGVSFAVDGSASATVSRMWNTLKTHGLVRGFQDGKYRRTVKLLEDGSRRDYTKPSGSKTSRRDVYFQLPLEYWNTSMYSKLDMPAKAMLMIAMSLRDAEFALPPTKRFAGFYGISESTIRRGAERLCEVGILTAAEPEDVLDLTSPTGWGTRTLYTLTPPYDLSVKKTPEDTDEEAPHEEPDGPEGAAAA